MNAIEQAAQLKHGLDELDIDLPAAGRRQLLTYLALLYKWNKTYNLTALREAALAVSHHLLDSLAILPYLPSASSSMVRVLDVGSGGGLPGIPLAIARPDWRFTLLDSNSKKTAFLQQTAIELGLPNVTPYCGRIEQYRPAEQFTFIVSRAFAELADFVMPSHSLLQTEGRWLAMKGVWPHDEIARLPDGGPIVETVHRLIVPGVEGERHLVVLRHE